MKTGAMVLGIVGGVLALLIGLVSFQLASWGGALGMEGSGLAKFLSLVVPIVGLVGGAIVKSNTVTGAVLMLLSALVIFILLGIGFFGMLAGIPLLLGGVLALLANKEDAAAA